MKHIATLVLLASSTAFAATKIEVAEGLSKKPLSGFSIKREAGDFVLNYSDSGILNEKVTFQKFGFITTTGFETNEKILKIEFPGPGIVIRFHGKDAQENDLLASNFTDCLQRLKNKTADAVVYSQPAKELVCLN